LLNPETLGMIAGRFFLIESKLRGSLSLDPDRNRRIGGQKIQDIRIAN